jgi:hypothetical protein
LHTRAPQIEPRAKKLECCVVWRQAGSNLLPLVAAQQHGRRDHLQRPAMPNGCGSTTNRRPTSTMAQLRILPISLCCCLVVFFIFLFFYGTLCSDSLWMCVLKIVGPPVVVLVGGRPLSCAAFGAAWIWGARELNSRDLEIWRARDTLFVGLGRNRRTRSRKR